MDGGQVAPAKEHRASRKKGKKKNQMKQAVAKPGALARRIRLAADRSEKRQKNPTAPIDRSGGDSAPRLVAVVGPSGVGKSTIIRNLVKHYSKRKLAQVVGPVTIVSGSKRRLTFLEVDGNLPSMIDAAKVADLVLLVVDASYGFEMETFEFLNVCAAHGMPKMIGVLTHLDNLKEGKQVRKIKKRFKDRFWAELYNGAKLFYLSGITTSGDYLKREVLNLARFISVTKYANIRWRAEHPYVLADRVEDITDKSVPDTQNRTIAAFGYLRGTPLRLAADVGWRVHVPGVGDLTAASVEVLADPCPPPDAVYELENGGNNEQDAKKNKRRVAQRERLIYAPMAPQVDGISYDRDAVYIDLPKENIRFSNKSTLFNPAAVDGDAPDNNDPDDGDETSDGEGEIMVKDLQGNNIPINERMASASLQLIKGGKKIVSEKFHDSRTRRKVLFPLGDSEKQLDDSDEEDNEDNDDDDSDEDESSDEEVAHAALPAALKPSNDSEEEDEDGESSDEEDKEVTDALQPAVKTPSSDSDEEDEDGESSDEEGSEEPKAASEKDSEDSGDDEDEEESESMEIEKQPPPLSESGEEDNDPANIEANKSIIGSRASSVTAPSAKDGSEEEDEDFGSESDGEDEDSGGEESEEESEIEEVDATVDEERVAAIWKNNMLDKSTSGGFSTTLSASKALEKHIYGDTNDKVPSKYEKDSNDSAQVDDDNDDDDFFRPKRPRVKGGLAAKGMFQFPQTALNDMTRPHPSTARDWVSNETLCTRLRLYRFGTGVKELANGNSNNNDDDDEAAYGDFEDLETGKVHGPGQDGDNSTDSDEDMDEIRQKKILKKQRFDAKWDEGGTRGDTKDEKGSRKAGPDTSSRAAARYEANKEVDFRKEEQERMDKVRDEELAGLDNETREALEGIKPGRYVRMVLEEVPTEFIRYFNPKYPVIVGGLKVADDEGLTFVRARVRRHRFKRGVLKSNDPIVMSIGWRRFQSIPIYDTEDQGGRRRYLKYSPEYLHCNATFYGPKVAPGAGVVMCQSLGREKASFRIAGTGVITELDSKFNVVKKLKLIGEAYKVFKNTAFVKGMFNSELEASKYIGASLRTVSGIRGSIKKAVSERSRGSSEADGGRRYPGAFRATFEDKVLMSDIVFLRCWVPVIAQKFCSMATTLLDKERLRYDGLWRMKTTREIRERRQLAIPAKQDSFYKENIERTDPHFAKQRLPKSLEASLPYASKPKNFSGTSKNNTKNINNIRKRTTFKERAIVVERDEKERRKFMSNLSSIRGERDRKRKASKKRSREKREREMKRNDEKHAAASKANKKRKFAIDGAREKKRAEHRVADNE